MSLEILLYLRIGISGEVTRYDELRLKTKNAYATVLER